MGGERNITFDIATAAFGFDPVAFGISQLRFVNAPAAELLPGGFNVVVLQTTDDDSDPACAAGRRGVTISRCPSSRCPSIAFTERQ